jgi:hypothetical protein
VITPGDIAPRQDSSRELYVAVLSNSIHLAANNGRVITCPFIPAESQTTRWLWLSPSTGPKAPFSPGTRSMATEFGTR